MFKTKHSFFGETKTNGLYRTIKRDLTKSKEEFQSIAIQENRLSEDKLTRSQALPPKRLTTSYLGNRKAMGELKYQKFFRDNSEKKSIYQRKTSSSAYTKNRKEQKQSHSKPNALEVADSQFLTMAEQIEDNENYEDAARILIKILNYTIDFKLPKHFLRTIKQIAEFYAIINKNNFAIFYFNQCRVCSFKLNQPEMLVDSLIGCSLCCRKDQMFEEAILFLKKGLQYCWFHGRPEQELKIYDQFGKIYYLMGELEKANNFHQKFINAVLEPENSPQRLLSKQRLTKFYTEEDSKIYTEIDVIFLTSLSLPILSFKELPPLPNIKDNTRQNFTISTKYFNQVPEVGKLLIRILESDFFGNQMQQPDSVFISRHASFSKKKKFDFIDFKLKQHLKEMGIGYKSKIEIKPKNLEYRQPLDEKVKKKLKEPGLDPDWQFKMVREIKRDRQNKLFKVHSQIRVRGKNRVIRPEVDHIRKIFMPLYK